MLLDWRFWRFALICVLAVFVVVGLPAFLGWVWLSQGLKMLLPWVRDTYRYVTGKDEEDETE